MSEKVWLVAGLGNPGSAYEGNRHNAGFMLIDKLSSLTGIDLDKKKFNGIFGKGKRKNNDIILLKPFSYMNRSGFPVRDISQYFNVDSSRIIVVYDDLDLPPGKIRIRKQGGAGGHNGVKSIIENLGTDNFGRIKIGIGRPERREQVTSYVLHDFDKDEIEVIENGIEKAAKAAEEIILNGYTACMNNFNK
ncbi:MAG: aminoacyl-tRNA hydrolase [Desulfobacteraceae bacterium]|nr:aminoacyl-tRNA hydrolase [Desulfobacteraceae bacterium]MCB9494684.1 aminoacyl-tRNA hydrolase [Desulfobacteraceae bacterium]